MRSSPISSRAARRSLIAVVGLAAAIGAPVAASTPPDSAPVDSGAEAPAGRFSGTDAFCTAAAAPAEGLEDVDEGITAEAITITHVQMDAAPLVDLGYAYDSGDPKDQVETFVRLLNEECGGVGGRQLQLEYVLQPVPGLNGDPQLEAQESCSTIAEDQHSVAAFSFTGIGMPIAACLTGPNEVMFISTMDFTATDFEQSNGRLFSMSHSPTDILKYAALELAPELAGQRVAVVYGDAPGNAQIVQQGLLDTLESAGVEVARVDVLGCNNAPQCTGNLTQTAQGIVGDDIDAVFPLVDALTMPIFLGELVTQGAQPGDFQFYNTSFQAMDSELVAGQVVQFGGEEVGALYDGAVIIAGTRGSGAARLDDYVEDPFIAMCNQVYDENSDVVDAPYDMRDDADNIRGSVVASHCAVIRNLARAIEAAGPNPSRDEIATAFASLGPVDNGEGAPNSFEPGKPTAPDAIVRTTFHYPCPVEVTNEVGHCILPDTGFLPLPSGPDEG